MSENEKLVEQLREALTAAAAALAAAEARIKMLEEAGTAAAASLAATLSILERTPSAKPEGSRRLSGIGEHNRAAGATRIQPREPGRIS